MKTDGRLARCPLKGIKGDAIFALLCGCGHNIRKILARLKALLVLLFECLSPARRVINAFTDRSIAVQIAA
jgi:IS5 family transposase